MKKILVNAFINLNLGDDLFLKILFERYPNVKWILPKGGKRYTKIFSDYRNVRVKSNMLYKINKKLYRVNKKLYILTLKKYDAAVYIGGSIFMQIPEWKDQFNERKLEINYFNKHKKPYYILGSNFGPYKDNEFIEKNKNIFKLCSDICFRDSNSYELFSTYTNIRYAPDIVFSLKDKKFDKIKNSIGISLISISNRDELKQYSDMYISKIVSLVDEAINRNMNITFFSFCEQQGDISIIEEVITRINPKNKHKINIINYCGNINEFLSEFAKMENIIGTRFHSCILSQVYGQGLYPLIYSDKTYNVLKDLRLDKEYCYIKNIDKLDVKHVLNIINNNKITDMSVYKKAEEQFEGVDRYVRGD